MDIVPQKRINLKLSIKKWTCPINNFLLIKALQCIDKTIKMEKYWRVYFAIQHFPTLAMFFIGIFCYDGLREVPYFPLMVTTLVLTACIAFGFPLTFFERYFQGWIETIFYTTWTIIMTAHFALSISLMVLIFTVNWAGADNVNLFIGFFILSLFFATPMVNIVFILLALILILVELLLRKIFGSLTWLEIAKIIVRMPVVSYDLAELGQQSCPICLENFAANY